MTVTIPTGSIVRLKSGGPPMTVEGIESEENDDNYERLQCSWFDGNKSRHEAFVTLALELVTAPVNEDVE